MKSRLALLAVPFLALACGNSPDQASPTEPAPQFKRGGNTEFFVFCTDTDDCTQIGSEVAVTPKMNHRNSRSFFIETCTKDPENENCLGDDPDIGNNYQRDANRDWMIEAFGED